MKLPLNITALAVAMPCESCPPPHQWRVRTETGVITIETDGSRLLVADGQEYVVSEPITGEITWEKVKEVVGINANA